MALQNSEGVVLISDYWIRVEIAVLFLLSVFSRKLPGEITRAWSLGVSSSVSPALSGKQAELWLSCSCWWSCPHTSPVLLSLF